MCIYFKLNPYSFSIYESYCFIYNITINHIVAPLEQGCHNSKCIVSIKSDLKFKTKMKLWRNSILTHLFSGMVLNVTFSHCAELVLYYSNTISFVHFELWRRSRPRGTLWCHRVPYILKNLPRWFFCNYFRSYHYITQCNCYEKKKKKYTHILLTSCPPYFVTLV